jgi:hypothetical protein
MGTVSPDWVQAGTLQHPSVRIAAPARFLMLFAKFIGFLLVYLADGRVDSGWTHSGYAHPG